MGKLGLCHEISPPRIVHSLQLARRHVVHMHQRRRYRMLNEYPTEVCTHTYMT